jgi:hypothetical protein
VVGVNVQTAGDQVSFLVPVDRVITLVGAASAPGYRRPARFIDDVARQIRENQDTYLANMFAGTTPTVRLGHFTLPTEPAPFFRCWADADRPKERPYETVLHRCSTDDYVFVSSEQASGIVELEHELITSRALNPLQFSALHANTLSSHGGDGTFAGADEVTPFRCETRNVRNRTLTLRAAFCARRYRKLAGLYDVVLKAAAARGRNAGVVTTLTLSGVSFENAQRLAHRYLERIGWQP